MVCIWITGEATNPQSDGAAGEGAQEGKSIWGRFSYQEAVLVLPVRFRGVSPLLGLPCESQFEPLVVRLGEALLFPNRLPLDHVVLSLRYHAVKPRGQRASAGRVAAALVGLCLS